MTWVLGLLGWLACSVLSYLVGRQQHRREFGHWTQGDRVFLLVLSMGGPYSLALFGMTIVFDWLFPWDRPAKW